MTNEELKKSAELLRKELGSIDLSDAEKLEAEELSNEEALNMAADADTFYRSHFQKIIKLLIWKEYEWIGTQTQNENQLMFGRGTINGLMLINDWFIRQADTLAQARVEAEEGKKKKDLTQMFS